MKNRKLKSYWLALVLAGLTGVSHAQNICIEYGPYLNAWSCYQAGYSNSPGSLNTNTIVLYPGDPVPLPYLVTAPGFANGWVQRLVSSTCSGSYWQNKTLRYIAGPLSFSNAIPLVFTNTCTNTYTAYVDALPTSLVAWWPGQGTAADLVYTNNGSMTNVTFEPAIVGQGFSFDGVTSGIDVPDSPYLNFGTSNDLSIECWIRAAPGSGDVHIVTKYGDVAGRTQGYIFYLAEGKLATILYTSTGSSAFLASSGPNLRDDLFHHVAVTLDRHSNVGKLYADGQSVLSFTPTSCYGDLYNPAPLRIGYFVSPPRYYHGVIDELSIYMCALSSDTIQSLYNAAVVGKAWTNSPVGCAPLPAGCACNSAHAVVGTVTIKVITDTDSDGDGVSDRIELVQGRNPNVNGFFPDTNNTVNLRVFTPLK